MNILFYTKEFPPEVGGIETYTYNVARHFCDFGHNVVVIVRRMHGDREFDEAQSFKVIRIRKPFAPAFLYRLYTFMAVPRLIRKHEIDFAFLPYWFRFSSIIYHLNRFFGLRYFITCYGEEVAFAHKRRHHSHKRLLRGYKRADRIFAISDHTKGLLLKLGIEDERVAVVRPGIETSCCEPDIDAMEKLRGNPMVGGRKILITVARLVRKKGHDNVLRALSAIKERYPDFVYLIIGEGEEEQNLRSLTRELGLEEHVIFMGRIADELLKSCYALCDLLIMTTREVDDSRRTEGFGIVYLEANLFGKPVIAGHVGGVGDAVVDGETGILVNPDSVDEIRSALENLLSDGELRRRLGENGRKRALQDFSWETVARRLEALMLSSAQSTN